MWQQQQEVDSKTESGRQDSPVIDLTTLPTKLDSAFEELDLERPQRRLTSFFSEREVSCLDLLPDFHGRVDTYAPRDTHWNVAGNRLAAERIAAWLPAFQGTP